jgi:ABC-2 type transport system ATP-binding protein
MLFFTGGIMMLVVSNLTKKYSSTLANDDLSFSLRAGEIGVLLGPNGAGKSTAIKCIMGLLRFSGTIEIDGKPNKSEAAKKIMGYVPEMPALYDLLTVEEHAEFIIRAYKLDKSAYAYADELMERLELSDKRKKLGKELSKGMQQKVSIMCALLPRPGMLLLDEPLVGLDPHAIKELKTMLVELRSRGTAVFVSTHMIDSVEGLWDKVFIMVNGRIAATRDHNLETVDSNESLEDLFFSITEGQK